MKNIIKLCFRISLILITFFVFITALWGGLQMMIDPSGQSINIQVYLPLITFVSNFYYLGLLLILLNGVPHFIAMFLFLTNNNYAGIVSALVAIVLVIWSCVQLFIIGWMFYSGFYLIFAIIEIVLSVGYFVFLKKHVYNNSNNKINNENNQ